MIKNIKNEKRVYIPWHSCGHCKFYRDVYNPKEKRYVCFFANVCRNAIEIHADESDYKGAKND